MIDEHTEDALEMPPVADQQPIETLGADGADEALARSVSY